jgi:hypothetical protein
MYFFPSRALALSVCTDFILPSCRTESSNEPAGASNQEEKREGGDEKMDVDESKVHPTALRVCALMFQLAPVGWQQPCLERQQ